MKLEPIQQAYRAENLIGSYFTAPLRTYNRWFQSKIQAAEGAWQKIAWKVGYIVSAVFAYLSLGLLALIGVAINLCVMPPKNGYSLWARLMGVPKRTEEFCSELRKELLFALKIQARGTSGSACSSSDRSYAYSNRHQLSFYIEDLSGLSQAGVKLEDEDGNPIDPQIEDAEYRARSNQLEPHILYIQNLIRGLSQKYGWYPEKYVIETQGHKPMLIIPLPDHIPLPV